MVWINKTAVRCERFHRINLAAALNHLVISRKCRDTAQQVGSDPTCWWCLFEGALLFFGADFLGRHVEPIRQYGLVVFA